MGKVATTKRCYACGEDKPTGGFHRNKKSHDGLQSACKDCSAERNRAEREKQRAEGTFACRRCTQPRAWSDFPRLKTRRSQVCIHCAGSQEDRIKRKSVERSTIECSYCGDRQPRAEFGRAPDGRLSTRCNGCREAIRLTLEIQQAKPRTPALVEHPPGSPGWRRLEEGRRARYQAGSDALAANTAAALGREK